MNRLALRREEDLGFWRALPWAIAAWVLTFFLVAHFLLASPRVAEPPPQAVDARIVELPDTPPPQQVQTPAPPQPKEKLPEPSPVPIHQVQDKSPPPPPVSKPQAAAPVPPPPPPAPAPAQPNEAFGTENHGTLATYKPDPALPDDLLDQASGLMVTAHFNVNADGTFTVDLVQKSVDPRLKKAILGTLKTWRFSPEVRGGKAVAGAQDITFRF